MESLKTESALKTLQNLPTVFVDDIKNGGEIIFRSSESFLKIFPLIKDTIGIVYMDFYIDKKTGAEIIEELKKINCLPKALAICSSHPTGINILKDLILKLNFVKGEQGVYFNPSFLQEING
jgi:hypothetical protein